MTKRLGVIGDPIAHSLSPLIHNGWFQELGIDASYEALHVPDGRFSTELKSLEKRDVLGVNVTLPHKHSALNAASEVSDAARAIGAANTLTFLGDGKWRADNTDAPGFLEALGVVDPASDRALVLGAGGSARAIVYALSARGIKHTILNRTESKAADLALDLGKSFASSGSLAQYKEYIDSATIIINTTSMGHEGKALDLPNGDGRPFFDISYGKVAAPQLRVAKENGWTVRNGLSMLVAQAAHSFEIWFGQKPDRATALKRCVAALETKS